MLIKKLGHFLRRTVAMAIVGIVTERVNGIRIRGLHDEVSKQ